jgi:hypothetical protein
LSRSSTRSSAGQEHGDRRNKSGDDDKGVNETKRRLANVARKLEPDSRPGVPPAPGLLRLLHLPVGLQRKAAKRQYSNQIRSHPGNSG